MVGKLLVGLVAAALMVGVVVAFTRGHTQSERTLAGGVGEMQVDCDASQSGVQSNCTYAPGSTFNVEIHITDPPAGGYFFFQEKLMWTEGVVNYIAGDSATEALWPNCTIPAQTDNRPLEQSVLFACVPLPSLTTGSTFTGAVLSFEFQCKADPQSSSPPAGLESNQASLTQVPREGDFQGGTHLGDANVSEIDSVLTSATVTCAEPPATPTPRPTPIIPRWDVNEDGRVSAADIAIVVEHFGETFDIGNTINGVWNVDFTGDSSFSCTIEYTRDGGTFTSFADCVFASGSGSGTTDPETGAFVSTTTVGTTILQTEGTVSGDSMSGTWGIASLGLGGVFEGTRK